MGPISFFYVAVGGAIDSVGRYWVTLAAASTSEHSLGARS